MSLNKKKISLEFFICCVIAVIIAFMLFGCVATKKQREKFLRENCVVASTTTTKDSTSQKETIRHDSIYIDVAGPIQYLPSPCEKLCDSLGNLKPFRQESRHNGIKQSLESVGNVLVQKCDIDSLLQVNKTITKELEHYKTINKETQVHENCKLKHVTSWNEFCRIGFYIYATITLLWLLVKYLRNQFPALKLLKKR